MSLIRLRQMKQLLTSPVASVALNRWMSDKVISLEVYPADVIDNFTSELMQKKSTRWENMKLKKINQDSYNFIAHQLPEVDFVNLPNEELDELIISALDEGNRVSVKHLMCGCLEHRRCPSLPVLLKVLDNYSRTADTHMITKIKSLVETVDPVMYTSNGQLNHYLAEAMWIKGDVMKALELFESVYRKNVYLRRRVRLMLRLLILDLTNRSEAVLVNIVKFSERLLREYHDFFPLACVWQACFLSEWFTDQMLALDLLEKNEGLCKAVTANIPFVVSVSLKGHQTEVIYRLLEILLKYDMKMQYSIVLVSLFDYRFRQGNLRSCTEIIQWSVANKVMLPTSLHERFLMLLLDRSDRIPLPKKPPKPSYHLTF